MKIAKKRSCTAALMSVVMLFVTSCISHQKLPGNWALPEPAPIGTCPDISGQYIGLGESIKNKTRVSLGVELFIKNLPLIRWQEVSHISIQQQGQNLLNIVAWKDNEVLYSASLSKDSDDFSCEDGWLKFKKWTLWGIGMALETSATSRSFATADGYLLEKRESGGLLLLAILPIVSSSEEWFRFAPYEKSN